MKCDERFRRWRERLLALMLGVSAIGMGGCTSSAPPTPHSNPSTDGGTCPPDNPECKDIADVNDGNLALHRRGCPTCHGNDMSGTTTMLPNIPNTPLGEVVELYPPNLTSDPTGVAPPPAGKWTDDALALAIRQGIDADSQKLCPQMNHFSQMSDFEVYSIVMYLRSLPPVSKKVPRSVCPPEKTKAQQTLGP
jgi:hypothetical protein